MLRDVIFIGRKDVRYQLREKETLVWVFFMPVVFFFFIGTITSGFSGSGGLQKPVLALEAENAGFLGDQLVRRLKERGFEVVLPETTTTPVAHARRLALPPAFTDSVLAGRPVTARFHNEATGLDREYDNIRAGRAVYTVLADVIVGGQVGGSFMAESIARLNEMPRALTLEVSRAGERKHPPSGFEQAIPGIMVMFVLLVMTTSGAVLLVIERRQGLLRRIAATPIERRSVVLGKWAGRMALGVVQVAFGMLAGTVLFGMNWGANLGGVVLVMLAYGALMASVGILLGNVARTEGQAIAAGVISSNVLAALGGCWWPIEVTPEWMQKLQLFLPTGWAMDAMHKLISFGQGPGSVAPHVAGMAVGSVILMAVATRSFRYE
jgi:hypothetical protein